LIPEVLDIIEPPIIVRNKKNKEKLFGDLLIDIPEVLIEVKIFNKTSSKFNLLMENIAIKDKIIIKIINAISS
tara:strand:- start:383 stop:601 length:219 start_codon:yes stop_codon:yes gene_type:complete